MVKQTFKRNKEFSLSGVAEMGISSDSNQSRGFKFEGWLDADGNTYSDKQLTSFNVKEKQLSALWSAIKYTIDYDLNGGSDPGNETEYYVSSDTIVLTSSQKDYYESKGWVDKTTGETVSKIPYKSIGNKSLSADFELSGFTDIGMTMKFNKTTAVNMDFEFDSEESKVGVLYNKTKDGD